MMLEGRGVEGERRDSVLQLVRVMSGVSTGRQESYCPLPLTHPHTTYSSSSAHSWAWRLTGQRCPGEEPLLL